MCGIYGLAAAGEDAGTPEAITRRLTAMDRVLRHRGPDDHGVHVEPSVALGMRRLSIIDLSGGHQPLANEDQTVWAVFNGEIYNHHALRRTLLTRGHLFRSETDGEVIVHLWEDLREGLLDELDGMFAFALWDRRSETLLLARDRLGIKPLYFAVSPRCLSFASELKALLTDPELPRELNPAALSHYLTFGFTPPDRSIVSAAEKLEPAHFLFYHRGAITRRRWWRLPSVVRTISLPDAVEEIRARVVAAVRSHLLSDVPVGAFLSGGVDSATVVGTMRALGVTPRTFSIGFDDPAFDELRYARMVARRYGADHRELVVRSDAWSLAETLAWQLDEPFADVSAIPTYLVSKLAAADVKVVLTGDGGDELFAGYERYPRALRHARLLDHLPPSFRSALGRLSGALPESARGKRWLRLASLSPNLRYLDDQSLFPGDYKARLLSPDLASRLAEEDALSEEAAHLCAQPGDALGRLLRFDAERYLPEDLLTKVDRMAMAHSLEARPPLLDHHLVEAIFSLPSEYKLRGAEGKRIFRRAFQHLLPREVLARPKRGFGVPIGRWFRGPLGREVMALLVDRRTIERGHFDRRFLLLMFDEHRSGRRDHSLRMWALVMLELWCRNVLDRPATVSANWERAHG